jgi:L-asparagine transporter-like permease
MYSTGRMLRTLAADGEAPAVLGRLNARRSPGVAITVSSALMGFGVVLNYFVPEKAFGYVTSVATVCGIWTWCMILICHLRYRHEVRAGRRAPSPFPAPGGAGASAAALAALVAVLVMIGFDDDARVSLYVGGVWALCLVAGWAALRRGAPAPAATEPAPVRTAERSPARH